MRESRLTSKLTGGDSGSQQSSSGRPIDTDDSPMIVIDCTLQNRGVGEVEAQGTELNAGLESVLAEQSEHGIVMARIPLAGV